MLAEGFLLHGQNLLVFILPTAAMALTMSSVPIYLEFFGTSESHIDRDRIGRDYISALIAVIIMAITILSIIMTYLKVGGLVFLSILLVFGIEKFADELTRFYEFKREYNRWFAVQLARGLWIFLPIGFALLGFDYQISFFTAACFTALAMTVQFFLATKLRASLNIVACKSIFENIPFLGSSALLASNRQIPRLVVAYLFPSAAHIFQAMAQISQGVSLIFNVRFMVPYRKMIARRTIAFERVLRPSLSKIAASAIGISLLGALVAMMDPRPHARVFMAGLAIVMLADAVAFSLMSVYLGLIPWFMKPSKALATFAIAGSFSIAAFLFLYAILVMLGGSFIFIPITTTLLSLACVGIIIHRNLGWTKDAQ